MPKTCFLASLAIAFSPIGMMSSFLAITDGGMILFWSCACIYFVHQIENDVPLSYPFLGLIILCGAVFKWPIFIFWGLVLIFWWFYPKIISWRIIIGIAISLLALLPSLYWNASHDWVTFKHVFSTIGGGHNQKTGSLSGNLPEFIGAQAVLVSPILFILLVLALWSVIRSKSRPPLSPGLLFCAEATLLPLAAASSLALIMKMQGNWAIFAYPTAFILLAWYACERMRTGLPWLYGGILLSAIFSTAAFGIPYIQSHNIMSNTPISYRISPFRHNIGWNNLKNALDKSGYKPEQDFLFGDKYQTASILSFYGPDQKRAYFFNLLGTRKNQFSFWPGMDQEAKGKRGFFVVTENVADKEIDLSSMVNHYKQLLIPYFKEVNFSESQPLFLAYNKVVKIALIFECNGYLGGQPKDPALY